MSAHHWVDYLSAMLLIFLVGTNVSFIIQAQHLFHPRTTLFWRVFFTGKSIVTFTLIYVLIRFPGPFSWELGLIDVGAAVSLFALVIIYRDRPYQIVAEARENR
jgi:hypothetical protein